jgi:hypothetical protein
MPRLFARVIFVDSMFSYFLSIQLVALFSWLKNGRCNILRKAAGGNPARCAFRSSRRQQNVSKFANHAVLKIAHLTR